MQLPIFPLPICVLPEGYSQLRIFEPRYKRLVSEALKSGQGFGLFMLSDDKSQILPIGTRCNIIDFETLDDGLLGISIYGEERILIGDITIEHDGLKRAEVSRLDNWPKTPVASNQREMQTDLLLSDTLKDIFEKYPTHLAKYHDSDFDNMAWVCQRWLEIVPISAKNKYDCINTDDHHLAKSFLINLIKS